MISSAGNKPLFEKSGTVPDVSGAMTDYFQKMQFVQVTKQTVNFQVVETQNPLNFQGVIQPLSDRQLALKPEGQRAWTWWLLFADTTLSLDVDEIVLWNGRQTRVMARKDFSLYGYIQYSLVQDWGSVP